MNGLHLHEALPGWSTMIALDLAFVGLGLLGTIVVIAKWNVLKASRSWPGAALMIVGLWTGVSLYAADFATMTVLPGLIGMERSMTLMRDLHLGYSWYINSAAAVLITSGLVILITGLTRHISSTQIERDRFEGFARSASDWLWETDRDGRLVWQSTSGGRTDGYTFDRVRNMTREQVAGDCMNEADWESYRAAIRDHTDFTGFRYHYLSTDGDDRYVILDGEPLFSGSGAYLGHRGVARDVTGATLTDEKLKEHRERLLQATSLAGLGYFIWDVATDRCEFCSETYADIHGLTVSDYTQKASAITGQFTLVHPEDRDRVHEEFKRLRMGEKIDIEYRIVQPTGEVRFAREVAVPLVGPDGEIQKELGSIIDLTDTKKIEIELRENEARYEDAVRTAQLGHWVFDEIEDRISYCSDELARIHGISTEEYLARITSTDADIDLVHPDDRERYGSVLRRAHDEGTGYDIEHRIIRPDGEIRYLREISEAVLDDEGNLIQSRGTVQDVSDIKRVEKLLVAAKQEAEAANVAKSDFLAAMSHELRTPLNAISGFSEMILSEVYGKVGNDRYVEYVEHIRASGQHLNAIVDDILDLAKIEAGHMEIAPRHFALLPAINDITGLVGFRGNRDAGSIGIDVPEDMPELYADLRGFRQIMINLLSNADKNTPDDGSISIQASIETNDTIKIDVTDTGKGIPEADLPRIMEPFAQSKGNVLIADEGTGLGLSLSNELMKLHGGRLEIRSQVGVGTTVTLLFPPRQKPPSAMAGVR